ncbi:MAG: glycosyltransferase [Magnetospirillum sp. WYHS-4]
MAEQLAAQVARRGWGVMTGGYYGIMEAANRGASASGGSSCGVTIASFDPKAPNAFLTDRRHELDLCDRLRVLLEEADAIVVFDGGLGTVAEFTLAWVRRQVAESRHATPIILVGGRIQKLSRVFLDFAHLGQPDLGLLSVACHPEEVISQIEEHFSRMPPRPAFDVTVGIAAYNAQETICETLKSIWRQTVEPRETIVVDDGSTDGTVELARTHRATVPLRIVRQENAGTPGALNRLFASCRTPYLLVVDADDLLAPTALEKMRDAAHASPESAIIYSNHYCIDAAGNVTGVRQSVSPSEVRRSLDDLHERIDVSNVDNFLRVGHARLYRVECLRQMGGFAEDLVYAEDYDLILRAAWRWPLTHVDEPLYFYRWHPENKSSRFRPDQVEDVREAYRRHIWRRRSGRT